MKFKTKQKECQLIVKVKTSSKEIVDEKEIDRFSRVFLRGFLKPKMIKKNLIEYTGPVGISLYDRMKKPISKRDFLFIIEQVVVAVQKLKANDMPIITLGFYNPSVTLRFTAIDDTSGLDYLDWTYTREAEQSETNLETETGTLTFVDGKAELTLTASQAKQYRGNISFTVYDKAGNSTSATDDGNVFVVDTISPEMTAKYAGAEPYTAAQNSIGNVHYFNGDVEVEFTVTEANFDAEDVKISVSKDGGKFNSTTPDWVNNSVDVHIGTFTLSGDGDYVINVEYTDKSGNQMTAYQSETITIDTTVPEVEIAYSHNGDEQKTTFTVKEHNFRPTDVTITGTMQDINDVDIPYTATQLTEYLRNSKWEEIAPDTYQIEYDSYMNGIYNLTMDYKDLANWDAVPFVEDEFIIDHDAPTDVSIEYTKSILDTVLETVTLGFYKPDVKVTFTAFDTSAGVESFTWNYTKQNGQSDVNRPTDDAEKIKKQVIPAVQDGKDKSKFTAEVTLTATETEQLRGYISVLATDAYKNVSNKVTDTSYIIPLQLKFVEEFFEKIDLEIISDKGYFNELFSTPQKADIRQELFYYLPPFKAACKRVRRKADFCQLS